MLSNLCYLYLNSTEVYAPRVAILYPYELRNESILHENIKHVHEYIYDIIKNTGLRDVQERLIKASIFDIDKEKYSGLYDSFEKKIDELSEKINKNLSPYRWSILKDINAKIDDVHIKADYACVLEKI